MRELARKLLPERALRFARGLREAARRGPARRAPRLTRFEGEADSVLQGVVAYNEYGGYCVPLASLHRPAAQAILAGGVWERDTLGFLSSRGAGGGDVVHAGTYFGDFLPALSRSRAPGAKVWAFEPNPESYRCARITAEINQLRNVELRNAGLGEREGRLSMETTDAGGRSLGGASRILAEAGASASPVLATVDVVALDEAIPRDREISIIQLDVEGFEQQALCGALGTIRRCRPDLVLETLPGEPWLAANLWPLGYRLAGKLDVNVILSVSGPRP